MIRSALIVMSIVLSWVACGKESSKQNGGNQAASMKNYFAVESIDSLTCSLANAEQIVYDKAAKSLYLCHDEAWLVIETTSDKLDSLEYSQSHTLMETEILEIGDESCPYGGKIIIWGVDKNGDSLLNDDDPDLQKQNICFPQSDGTPILGEGSVAKGLYERYRDSVYRIEAICQNGVTLSVSYATGFRCSDTEVCSARHAFACNSGTLQTVKLYRVDPVLDSASTTPYLTISPVTVVSHGTKDVAKITGITNQYSDISLPIEADEQSTTGVPIPETLEETFGIHFPLGFFEQYVDFGVVISNDISVCNNSSYDCSGLDFVTNNNTDHGSSGSPIFSISRQKVVGILVSGTENENANYSWAVKALHLNEL